MKFIRTHYDLSENLLHKPDFSKSEQQMFVKYLNLHDQFRANKTSRSALDILKHLQISLKYQSIFSYQLKKTIAIFSQSFCKKKASLSFENRLEQFSSSESSYPWS